MKIGIMTFWWSEDNYGQLLQCYALQKYLQQMGHDAYLIRYNPEKDFDADYAFKRYFKVFNPIKVVRYLSQKIRTHKALLEQKKYPRYFELFREKYIRQSQKIYASYQDLQLNPPEADVYIVGSDQIWNFNSSVNKNYLNAFTLNFGNKSIYRLSYAASFGREHLDSVPPEFIENLKNFKFISVREITGKDICKFFGLEAKLVCDPTLLLSIRDWKTLFPQERSNHIKYIFVYMLSNTCKFSLKKLALWAAKKNLEIVYVTGNKAYKYSNYHDKGFTKSYFSINDWLYYLFNAEYVVTNSFHCCVFSLIFEKKVANVPLTGELNSTNNRITNLYEQLDIEKVEIKNNNFDVLTTIKTKSISYTLVEYSKELLLANLSIF